jgi:hypothetical protein
MSFYLIELFGRANALINMNYYMEYLEQMEHLNPQPVFAIIRNIYFKINFNARPNFHFSVRGNTT